MLGIHYLRALIAACCLLAFTGCFWNRPAGLLRASAESGIAGTCRYAVHSGVARLYSEEPSFGPCEEAIITVRNPQPKKKPFDPPGSPIVGKTLAETKSDKDGKFQIALKPGVYEVEAFFPRCPAARANTQTVTVGLGKVVDVQFDLHAYAP